MRPDEARDLGRLVGVAVRGGTSRVAETHSGIAGRVFRAVGPPAEPVRAVHDVVSGAVYASVRTTLGLSAVAVGAAAARTTSGRAWDEAPRVRTGLAVLNGVYGDLVARRAPALATRTAVRQDGGDVPLERGALAAAFPDATDRVVVLLHGLTESEESWGYRSVERHGRPGVTYGSRLREDLGLTPVLVRYNTGLHVSDNGRSVAALLQGLVAAWPVPLQDIVLIGHSMGGLVARSALHQAGSGTPEAAAWTALVRDTVTLGTPHLGAPLERGVHRLAHALSRLPETRPLARVLTARSAGIKDLRHGTLVEQDWRDRDLDAPGRGAHTSVPLHDGARHFVVLATVPRDPSGRAAAVLGDLLVPPRSACGDSGDGQALAFPPDHVHRVGGLHHLDLLNHPRVYEQVRRWLVERPEGPQPSAPGPVA